MDTELLVDERIDSGRDLLNQLARDGFDVTVAFWVRTGEERLWYTTTTPEPTSTTPEPTSNTPFWVRTNEESSWSFYIASDSVDPERVGDAYRTVYASLYALADSRLSLSDIKLIQTSNPVAQAAIRVRGRYPGRIPTRYHGERLADLAIEEAYIYAASGSMTSREVMQTVAALMDRTGAVQPSLITFTDGTTIQAIPVGLNRQMAGGVRVVLHEIASGQDRAVAVEEITRIQ